MALELENQNLLSVESAIDAVLSQCAPLGHEDVSLISALGRHLAESVIAALDLPPFTNSAMDGFALRSADTPGVLQVIGESAAGAPFDEALGPGQAVTISTGAALPDGADAVVMLELAPITTSAGALTIRVPDEVPVQENIRRAGSDVARGTEVLKPGSRIGPLQIGAAASMGRGSLSCHLRPRVAVLATGSELRMPGDALGPGEIYNSNASLLTALLSRAGAEVTVIPSAVDTVEAHREAFARALAHDVVISTGGVSVGGHDLVREVQRELGVRELFWRIALKPGKPLSFGVYGDVDAQAPGGGAPTLVFGLPGNPVSALVCFELFVGPALAALQGSPDPRPALAQAALATPVKANRIRDELIRVRMTGDGLLMPFRGQESHQMVTAALADGLAWIPAGAGTLPAGTKVGYLSFGAS
jgi:molybdopterin molybdotransferase